MNTPMAGLILSRNSLAVNGDGLLTDPDITNIELSGPTTLQPSNIERDKSERELLLSVRWEFWRAGYERSYHGEPGIVNLGEIG
ncbi:MAG: hypothetical protein WA739_14480 [Candidatus Acidiferrales bacterium]